MPSRISRDILKLVDSFSRLLFTAFFSISLSAVDRLQPIEVARFRSFAEGIVFDASGYAYVSHGRVISRISPDGSKSIWAETGAPSGHKILPDGDRKSTRLNSSHLVISYAVFCLKKKNHI